MGRGRSKKKNIYIQGENIMDENIIENNNILKDDPIIEEEIIIEEPVQEEPVIEEKQPLYQVKIDHVYLHRRAAPSLKSQVLGTVNNQEVYGIYEEINGLGKLEDDSWIILKYTKKI